MLPTTPTAMLLLSCPSAAISAAPKLKPDSAASSAKLSHRVEGGRQTECDPVAQGLKPQNPEALKS